MAQTQRLYRTFSSNFSSVPLSDTLLIAHKFFCAWEAQDVCGVWPDLPGELSDFNRFELQVFPWQVELLLHEGFSKNPEFGTRTLSQWNQFATSMNSLKAVCDSTWRDEHAELIWYEMFRIAHLQFPWQTSISGRMVARYFEIYGHPDLDPLVVEFSNISREQYFRLAVALYGFFSERENSFLQWPIDLDELDIPSAAAFELLKNVAATVEENEAHSVASSALDINFSYRRSQLSKKPLIFVEGNTTQGFICPIPRHLLHRLLDGLYFDLCDKPEFGSHYGSAFQEYILKSCRWIQREGLEVLPEEQYWVGRDRRDSLDILLSDESADVFVECKARRVSERSKVDLLTRQPIDSEMGKMIESLVKTYKNLNDGLSGHYAHWSPGDLPIYLVVVFLTDWYIFSRELRTLVFQRVDEELTGIGIDPAIRERVKLVTCSADEFEMLVSVLRAKTLDEVMSKKTDAEHEAWQLYSFLNAHYRREIEEHVPALADFHDYYEQMAAGIGHQ